MKRKTLILELAIIASFVFIYAISTLADLSLVSIPNILILTYDAPSELLLTLFSVQAGVSTISIAVVSIITGFTNETIYGVSVSKYITSIKPRFLKHQTLIITSILGIFFNYIFVSFNLFNCSIATLFFSVVITVRLVNNVAMIFKGTSYVRREISQYIKDNFNEELLTDLNNETVDAIENGATLILKRNYEAYKEILDLKIEEAKNKETPVEETLIINQLSDSISDIFEAIAKTKDAYRINDAIVFICDVYDIANKSASPFYLQIWNNISRT